MHFYAIFAFVVGYGSCVQGSDTRVPLSYAPEPAGLYVPEKGDVTTLLDLINSRSDLSELSSAIRTVAGTQCKSAST